ILLQLPVPDHIDSDAMIALIDPVKDVDGLTPTNAGLLAHGKPGLVPATPAGCMDLLRAADTPIEGAEAVVVGRPILVGRPVPGGVGPMTIAMLLHNTLEATRGQAAVKAA